MTGKMQLRDFCNKTMLGFLEFFAEHLREEHTTDLRTGVKPSASSTKTENY